MAKFDPFLSLRPHALHPGAIQGKEGIKFCHLATPDVTFGLFFFHFSQFSDPLRPGEVDLVAERRRHPEVVDVPQVKVVGVLHELLQLDAGRPVELAR